MSIKYYRLAKDEEPPEEFCAVRDMGGEPSEYAFYVPESEVAKLRELVRWMYDLFMRETDGAVADMPASAFGQLAKAWQAARAVDAGK